MIKNITKQGLISGLALLIISAFVFLAPTSAFANGNYGFNNGINTNISYGGFNSAYQNNHNYYSSNYNFGGSSSNLVYNPKPPARFGPITSGTYNSLPFCGGNCISRTGAFSTPGNGNYGW